MREVIQIRYDTGYPVVFVEGDKMLGVIGDEEIYRGILRQSEL